MKMFVYITLAAVAVALAALMFQFAACRNPLFEELCYIDSWISSWGY